MELQKYTYQLSGQPFDVALLYKNHAAQSTLHSSLDREHFISGSTIKSLSMGKKQRHFRHTLCTDLHVLTALCWEDLSCCRCYEVISAKKFTKTHFKYNIVCTFLVGFVEAAKELLQLTRPLDVVGRNDLYMPNSLDATQFHRWWALSYPNFSPREFLNKISMEYIALI